MCGTRIAYLTLNGYISAHIGINTKNTVVGFIHTHGYLLTIMFCSVSISMKRDHSGIHPRQGARCNSVVRAFARVGSILHGGPIELFLVPASAPRLMCVLSCLWDGAYKRTLDFNRKE